MALSMFGVTVHEEHLNRSSVVDVDVIVVRELAAICAPAGSRDAVTDEAAAVRHNDVVTAFLARGPVLPAPVGVVFKSRDGVERWLELHYGALTDALTFVENRVAGRVHVWKTATDERDTAADLVAVGTEGVRTLRSSAVASVTLRPDPRPGVILSCAFLVEASTWPDFVELVDERGRQSSNVRYELTGPWPPYDFVQMQLGA